MTYLGLLSRICFVMGIAIVPAVSNAGMTLDWEIGNRFRAFDFLGTSGELEPLAATELFQKYRLADGEDESSWLSRITALGSPYANNPGPWIETKGTYRGDFVKPPKQLVLKAHLETDHETKQKLSTELCVWKLKDREIHHGRCTEEIEKDDLDWSGGKLSIQQNDIELASTDVEPRFRIILGLGDSYAAGEGSPDKPTAWKQNGRIWPPFGKKNVNDYVRSGATWWSNRCDRSFYSYQNLVALHQAAKDKSAVVTFVHFACSGAEIVDGLLAPQRLPPGHAPDRCKAPKDRAAKDEFDPHCDVPHSQLYAALKLLCGEGLVPLSPSQINDIRRPLRGLGHGPTQWGWIRTRELVSCPAGLQDVDQILLSIGGNDIGFSGIIAMVLLPGKTRLGRWPLIGNLAQRVVNYGQEKTGAVCIYSRADEPCPNPSTIPADIRIKELPKRFQALGVAMNLMMGQRSVPVVLNTYPNPLIGTEGKRCANQGGNNTADDLDNEWYAARLNGIPDDWQVRFLAGESVDVQRKNIVELNKALEETPKMLGNVRGAGGLEWKTASLQNVMDGHGWCTGDDRKFFSLNQKVDDWKPYAPNTRYIRTANDSFLTQWPTKERDSGYNGTLHPNAQGYGAMAEEVLSVIYRTGATGRVLQQTGK